MAPLPGDLPLLPSVLSQAPLLFATGYHVLCARTEMDRLPAAKERQADVILRDVMIGGTTGSQMQAGLVAVVSRAVAVSG